MQTPRIEHPQPGRLAFLRRPLLAVAVAATVAACAGDAPAPDVEDGPTPDGVAAQPVETLLDDQGFAFDPYPGGDRSARTPITG